MKQTVEERRERAVECALARSAVYRLLSQALAYPTEETVTPLREEDLPRAQEAAAHLSTDLLPLLSDLGEQVMTSRVDELESEHRRVFSHVIALDCPTCETFYTCRHIFQETQELSDIGGFFRVFGLELAEKERLDHMSVELEFMHFLAHKEAHALTHHGPTKARLCRRAQRKFMEDHLGRWALEFARRLAHKAGGGYLACVASLTESFISAEIGLLRAEPEVMVVDLRWRTMSPAEEACPAAGECPRADPGG